jgi:hypothetical protein
LRAASRREASERGALLLLRREQQASRPTRISAAQQGAPNNTAMIVDHFAVGALPEHVTPSWDLRTLWVTNDTGNSLTPIDPRTGRHGRPVPVSDPYNLYFTADGRRAIVVAEAHRELDFREPHTMRLVKALHTPTCAGIDHMDLTAAAASRSFPASSPGGWWSSTCAASAWSRTSICVDPVRRIHLAHGPPTHNAPPRQQDQAHLTPEPRHR